jgi:hypothetical protein
MTKNEYVKILKKRVESKKKRLKKLSEKRYNPFSYTDFNAFYIQEEIKFISGIITQYE